MTALTEIQALIDKQLEWSLNNLHPECRYAWERKLTDYPIGEHIRDCDKCQGYDDPLLKIIDQYQRLGKWVQHDKNCMKGVVLSCDDYLNETLGDCTCGLSAELDKIKKELEG